MSLPVQADRECAFCRESAAESGNGASSSLVVLLLAFVAVLRGIRLPNAWSATQAQVDYRLGFVKRGLFGEIVSAIGIPIQHYRVFAMFSLVLLSLFLLLITAYVARGPLFRTASGKLLAGVFASSCTVTFFAHCAGYLDIVLALAVVAIAWIATWITTWRRAAAAVLILSSSGALIHEMFLIAFLPVCMLPCLFRLDAGAIRRGRYGGVVALTGIAAFIVGLTLLTSARRPLSLERVDAMFTALQSRADFPLCRDYFDVFLRGFADNLTIMRRFWASGALTERFLSGGAQFVPAIALFNVVSWGCLRRTYSGLALVSARAAVLFAGLSPLLMNLLGWDVERWHSLALFDSFIAMTIVACCADPATQGIPPLNGARRNACILLIALQMAGGGGLMDGRETVQFPFIDHVRAVHAWFHDGLEVKCPI